MGSLDRSLFALSLSLLLAASLPAKPMSQEHFRRLRSAADAVCTRAAAAPEAAAAVKILQVAYGEMRGYFQRSILLEAAAAHPSPELDGWLTSELAMESNAAIRRLLVKTLGAAGSPAVAADLRHVAENDADSRDYAGGCIVGEGNARAAAAAALKMLEGRFPSVADQGGWFGP